MLGKDLINKQMEDRIVSFVESKALLEFVDGSYSYLSIVYEVFAIEEVTTCHKKVAGKIHRMVSDISVKDLIILSERCRTRMPEFFWNEGVDSVNYRIRCKNFKFDRDKFKYLTDEEYISILRLGTFHPNGFYRQMCMERLRAYKDNLPFYILRMNDWVSTIRPLAYELSMAEMANDNVFVIFRALPMIDKVKNSRRREKEYINEMKQLLKMEKTGYGKGLIVNAIFNNYELSIEEIDEYLLSKNAIVRFKAVEYKYKKLKQPWLGIESLLLDKSKRIR